MTRAKHGTRATERDLWVLQQLAHFSCVYQPDMGRLLASYAGGSYSQATVRQYVDRLRTAGWATGRKVLHKKPRIVCLTEAGGELIGISGYHQPQNWQTAERVKQELSDVEEGASW